MPPLKSESPSRYVANIETSYNLEERKERMSEDLLIFKQEFHRDLIQYQLHATSYHVRVLQLAIFIHLPVLYCMFSLSCQFSRD